MTGMEVYHQLDDLKLLCVEAGTDPRDVRAAFTKLLGILPGIEGRIFFGISYQALTGEIVYKAAVLEKGLPEKLAGCEEFILEKGDYLAELVRNWRKDQGLIGAAFLKMTNSGEEIVFPFVEWYQEKDVLCMVRLEKSH